MFNSSRGRWIVAGLFLAGSLVIATLAFSGILLEPIVPQSEWFVKTTQSATDEGSLSSIALPTISVVTPIDASGQKVPMIQAQMVNIEAWPSTQVNCKAPYGSLIFSLYMAKGDTPLERVADPMRTLRTIENVTFPALTFDNVPVDFVSDSTSNYVFVLGGQSTRELESIVRYGGDPRTIEPVPQIPTGIANLLQDGESVMELDSRIQMVVPHDGAGNLTTVDQARFVNVVVDFFKHGTLESVPLDFPPNVQRFGEPVLMIAEGNTYFDPFGPRENPQGRYSADKITYEANGQTYPRWVFNNVPVSPETLTHMIVVFTPVSRIQSIEVHPMVWTHTASHTLPPTEFQLPPSCVP